MKGSVHALIGASAPASLVLTQDVTIPQGVVMSVISAGFALLPDLDHPDACASKALGVRIHRIAHRACKATANATATRRDLRSFARSRLARWDPYHRTLSHTVVATLTVAVVTYGLASLSPWCTALVAALGGFLLWPLYRQRRRGGPRAWAAGGFTLMVVCTGATATLLGPYLLTLAVAGGYLSHLIADACTKAGVPLLWPVTLHGKRWWRIRLLGGLVASGSRREKAPAAGVGLVVNLCLLFLYF